MPQTDGLPDRERDENVEYRSGGNQGQDHFENRVCQTESRAVAHPALFHVFTFFCRLELRRTMDLDTADHNENDDDYRKFYHIFPVPTGVSSAGTAFPVKG